MRNDDQKKFVKTKKDTSG